MVCIIECLLCDSECIGKSHTLIEHKDPDKLGDSNSGVSIIELNSIKLCKLAEIIAVSFLIGADDILN